MTNSNRRDEINLRARVVAEFLEMPGLMLTLPQAMRLFDTDRFQCEETLELLIAEGLLATNGRMFMRADAGSRVA